MDSAHVHLLLNHISILGTFFGLCLLIYGLLRKKRDLENAGFATLVIVALLTIPVFFSGEEAEETVEHISGVSEHYIELHEELAETAAWMMIATGSVSLFTLILTYLKDEGSRALRIITLILAASTFGVMAAVGNYGGKIRHSELRGDTTEQTQMDKEIDED